LLQTPVVSYTTFSPLPVRAVCLCGPIRQVSPPRGLPGGLLCGERTFLEARRLRDHLTSLDFEFTFKQDGRQ